MRRGSARRAAFADRARACPLPSDTRQRRVVVATHFAHRAVDEVCPRLGDVCESTELLLPTASMTGLSATSAAGISPGGAKNLSRRPGHRRLRWMEYLRVLDGPVHRLLRLDEGAARFYVANRIFGLLSEAAEAEPARNRERLLEIGLRKVERRIAGFKGALEVAALGGLQVDIGAIQKRIVGRGRVLRSGRRGNFTVERIGRARQDPAVAAGRSRARRAPARADRCRRDFARAAPIRWHQQAPDRHSIETTR